MNRRGIFQIFTAILLTTGIAHAETINQATENCNEVLAAEPAPPYEGAARIDAITRQRDGEIYRLDLAKAIPLTQLKAKPSTGKVKLIEATLVTEKQERIPVKAFTNIVISAADPALISETLNLNVGIASIEIRAEAMGGEAALEIKAVSNQEAPQLALREDACKKNIDAVLKAKLEVVQKWAARVEGSAPGSIQEKYAIKEFNKYVVDFNMTFKADKAAYASTEYTLTLLNFFTERYNASRADSAAEAAYKSMATETFAALLASIQSFVPCRTVSSEGLINIALDFQKRYEAGKPDSRAGKLYETMIVQIAKYIPAQYAKELATKNYNFRAADNEGNKYYKLFLASKPESFLKATQRDMSLAAYAVAEQALIQEVKSMDNEQRYQLIVEFQAKYNNPAQFHQETMMKYLLIISENGTLFRILL